MKRVFYNENIKVRETFEGSRNYEPIFLDLKPIFEIPNDGYHGYTRFYHHGNCTIVFWMMDPGFRIGVGTVKVYSDDEKALNNVSQLILKEGFEEIKSKYPESEIYDRLYELLNPHPTFQELTEAEREREG